MSTARKITRTPVEGTLGVFLDRAGASLLNAQQEVELIAATEVGVLARDRLSRGCAEAERADLELLVDRGERALARMVAANLRLVVMVARGHRTPGVALIDLVQEGALGLLRAIQRFDHHRGVKFSTYAVPWIRQAVQRGNAELVRSVRLPLETSEQLRMLHAASYRLQVAGSSQPSVAQLATATGIPVGLVRELLTLDRSLVPIDEPRPADHPLHAQLSTPDGLAELGHTAVRDARIEDALSVLDELERTVIERRFGFAGPASSAQSVASALGLTQSRVRTLERQALDRLRRHPALRAVA